MTSEHAPAVLRNDAAAAHTLTDLAVAAAARQLLSKSSDVDATIAREPLSNGGTPLHFVPAFSENTPFSVKA